MSRRPPHGDGETRQTALPAPKRGSPDDQPTGHVVDLGAVAELRAAVMTPQATDKLVLPLFAMPDQIVVGRGTMCDWQLDDASLSRKHAQFRWNGRELTVEDLGSANGTRVNGKPARNPLPVRPGEPVQLGTVIISLELKGAAQSRASDEQATRLVSTPGSRPQDDPGLAPLPAAPTVIRPQPARGMPNQNAALFRPERHAARPDEPTRPWDSQAALVKAPENAFDGELIDQLKRAFKEKRRMFVLAGAAAWVAVLLIVWSALDKPEVEEDPFAGNPPKLAAKKPGDKPVIGKPTVEQLPLDKPLDKPAVVEPQPGLGLTDDRDVWLADAVAAYDQGKMPEALALFKRLAADPKDTGAKFMVELIESRMGRGTP